MSLSTQQINALYKLYPNVIRTLGESRRIPTHHRLH